MVLTTSRRFCLFGELRNGGYSNQFVHRILCDHHFSIVFGVELVNEIIEYKSLKSCGHKTFVYPIRQKLLPWLTNKQHGQPITPEEENTVQDWIHNILTPADSLVADIFTLHWREFVYGWGYFFCYK
jgi:hypothetical protein